MAEVWYGIEWAVLRDAREKVAGTLGVEVTGIPRRAPTMDEAVMSIAISLTRLADTFTPWEDNVKHIRMGDVMIDILAALSGRPSAVGALREVAEATEEIPSGEQLPDIGTDLGQNIKRIADALEGGAVATRRHAPIHEGPHMVPVSWRDTFDGESAAVVK